MVEMEDEVASESGQQDKVRQKCVNRTFVDIFVRPAWRKLRVDCSETNKRREENPLTLRSYWFKVETSHGRELFVCSAYCGRLRHCHFVESAFRGLVVATY